MNDDTSFERVSLPETTDRDRVIHRVANAVHQLNYAVQKAVDAGISVELVRVSRYHSGTGQWGDQIVPTVSMSDDATKA